MSRVQPKRKSKHQQAAAVMTKDSIDESPEHTIMMAHDSRHWAVRIDELDAFGAVTVYDAEGHIIRIIERDALKRPWQARTGNSWNNCIFPKRISDRV